MLSATILMLAVSPLPAGWRTYTNVRFAFTICYPAGFTAGPPPANSDGLAFGARDGAALSAWGSNSLERTLPDERRMTEEGIDGITYRAGGRNWFVFSGTAKGRIFYRKTFYADERFVTFDLSYPASAAARYKPIVAQMERCFRYGQRPF